MRRHGLLAIALLSLAGCATNPVTGKKEIQMVSQGQEVQIGEQQYGPGASRKVATMSPTPT